MKYRIAIFMACFTLYIPASNAGDPHIKDAAGTIVGNVYEITVPVSGWMMGISGGAALGSEQGAFRFATSQNEVTHYELMFFTAPDCDTTQSFWFAVPENPDHSSGINAEGRRGMYMNQEWDLVITPPDIIHVRSSRYGFGACSNFVLQVFNGDDWRKADFVRRTYTPPYRILP